MNTESNTSKVDKFPLIAILFLFIWFPAQDTLLSLAYRIYPASIWIFGLILKDVLLVIILAFIIIKNLIKARFPIHWIDMLAFFYILLNCIYLPLNLYNIPINIRFTTFRSILLPVLFYLVGRYAFFNKADIAKLFTVIIFMGVLSAVFGFIEVLLPTEYLWNGVLDLNGFLHEIKGFTRVLPRNVPVNFWGYLGRRLAGLSASPIAQGYFLEFIAFLIFGSWIYKYRSFKKTIPFFIILGGIFLTITRASILSMLLVIPVFFLLKPTKEYLRRTAYIYLTLLIIGSPFLNKAIDYGDKTISLSDTSSRVHYYAIGYSIDNLSQAIYAGQGFGTAGGWINSLGGEILGAWENTYCVIAFQIGLPGLLLFLIWWILLSAVIFKAWIKGGDPQDNTILLALCLGNVAFFLTGFVSEQILTFSSVAHFWIFSGIAVNISLQQKNNR